MSSLITTSQPIEDAAHSCKVITRAFSSNDLPNGAVMYSKTARFKSAGGHWLIMLNKNREGLHYTLSPHDRGLRRNALYLEVAEAIAREHDCDHLMFHGEDHCLLVGVTLKIPVPEALVWSTMNSDYFYFRRGPLGDVALRRVLSFDNWLKSRLRDSAVEHEIDRAVHLDRSEVFYAA